MAGHSGESNNLLEMFVYILRSIRDGKLYIGQSSDVESRLERHNAGLVVSTRHRTPFELICSKKFDNRSEAVNMERYLKSLKGGNGFKKMMKQWGVAKW
jgi:putative endonuclease